MGPGYDRRSFRTKRTTDSSGWNDLVTADLSLMPNTGPGRSRDEGSRTMEDSETNFPNDAEGVTHALNLQKEAIRLVGQDVACDLFFAEERSYWESRNRAGQIQKRRQDSLGLGWSNHDHHTFRSSRRFFADLIEFLLRFGFQKRERYYAARRPAGVRKFLNTPLLGSPFLRMST